MGQKLDKTYQTEVHACQTLKEFLYNNCIVLMKH